MRVLVIDDDKHMLRCIRRILERRSHEVVMAENPSEAFLALAKSGGVDVILCDVHLRETHAGPFLAKLSALDAGRVVLMTGGASSVTDEELLAGRKVLYKPFANGDLLSAIAAANDVA